MVEYGRGLPTAEQVKMHADRGGWWQYKDEYHPPQLMRLAVHHVNEDESDRTPHVWSRSPEFNTSDAARWHWRPVTADGDALPWEPENPIVAELVELRRRGLNAMEYAFRTDVVPEEVRMALYQAVGLLTLYIERPYVIVQPDVLEEWQHTFKEMLQEFPEFQKN